MTPAQGLHIARQALKSWKQDYAPSMGAAIAYYTLFSIAPLLLIVISVAGFFFGEEAVQGQVFAELAGLLGAESAKMVQDMLIHVSEPEEGAFGTVTGVVMLLIGASTVFAELQGALDRIWRAPARKQGSGLWGLVRSRLLSFGLILGFAFLLMVSLIVSAALSAVGKWWGPLFQEWEVLAQLLNVAVNLCLITTIFAMIYKFMPRVDIPWRDVWVGAAVTAALFVLGEFLIGLYLGKSEVATGFGAAGSLVLLMVWVYYSAQIFLLGAEFTWVYAHELGSRKGERRPQGIDSSLGEPARNDAPSPGRQGHRSMPADAKPAAGMPPPLRLEDVSDVQDVESGGRGHRSAASARSRAAQAMDARHLAAMSAAAMFGALMAGALRFIMGKVRR